MNRLRNALLLLLLLVCAASFWQARQRSPAAPPVLAPGAREDAPVALAPGSTVHLQVLNGTGQPGLARRSSRELSALGCVVVGVSDAPHDSFATTLLINRRLPEADARRLAGALGVVLLHEWDARCPADAVLVLGFDHERLRRAMPGWLTVGEEIIGEN